jgi:hypothetical protein
VHRPVVGVLVEAAAACAVLEPLGLNPSPPHAAKDPELGPAKFHMRYFLNK